MKVKDIAFIPAKVLPFIKEGLPLGHAPHTIHIIKVLRPAFLRASNMYDTLASSDIVVPQ